MKKDSVFYFAICFLIPEIFKFLYYAKYELMTS